LKNLLENPLENWRFVGGFNDWWLRQLVALKTSGSLVVSRNGGGDNWRFAGGFNNWCTHWLKICWKLVH
jgi:hypothetical protein